MTPTEAPDGDPGPGAASRLDLVNRSAWASASVLGDFTGNAVEGELGCWTDLGERAALLAVSHDVRGAPALDVGVGVGRTVQFMLLLTDDYVAIDYTPEMVEECSRRFPSLDVRLGDARDLKDFADGTFGFVYFSFNGIDAVDHDDRRLVLEEMARALRPGGILLFSSHNKSGPCYRTAPWRVAGPAHKHEWPYYYRFGRLVVDFLRDPWHFPRSVRNWRRLRSLWVDEDGWGLSTVEAHDFDLLIHFTTLERQRAELAAIGLDLEATLDCENGRELPPGADTSGVRYFHFIARKRAAA